MNHCACGELISDYENFCSIKCENKHTRERYEEILEECEEAGNHLSLTKGQICETCGTKI